MGTIVNLQGKSPESIALMAAGPSVMASPSKPTTMYNAVTKEACLSGSKS